MPDDTSRKKLTDKIQRLEQQIEERPKSHGMTAGARATMGLPLPHQLEQIQEVVELYRENSAEINGAIAVVEQLGLPLSDDDTEERRRIDMDLERLRNELQHLDSADPTQIIGKKGVLIRNDDYTEYRYESSESVDCHRLATGTRSQEARWARKLWDRTEQAKTVKNTSFPLENNPAKSFRSAGGKKFFKKFVKSDGFGNWGIRVP